MPSHWKATALGMLVLCVAVFMSTTEAMGQRGAPSRGAPGAPGGTGAANETYSVVEIAQEYQVVPKSGMNDLKKRMKEDLQLAQKAYADSKKDKSNKVPVEKPDPKNYIIKMMKSSIKTAEEAENYRLKLEKERDEKGGKKTTTGKKSGNW